MLEMIKILELLEMLKMIESIINKHELTNGKKDTKKRSEKKDVKEKDAKEKKMQKQKRRPEPFFSLIIMAYWINVGSRGQAVITAGLKKVIAEVVPRPSQYGFFSSFKKLNIRWNSHLQIPHYCSLISSSYYIWP